MQTSESFRVCALLSFSGGLQDAYTYNVRGHVFANAQTGNVVLMSQNLMTGRWHDGLKYMLPLIAFAAGIFIAERVENRFKEAKSLHWRQIVIAIEMVMLCVVGFLPESLNMAANMLVSLACAMQVQTFRTVHGYGYASTMCIGNLRSGTESLSKFLRDREREALFKALHFFGIIVIFALGAGAGGVISAHYGLGTIWLSVILLVIAALMMTRKTE
ncbi:MAG: DUF1275 domain-containing protein [Ruminococcus sp.]|nr:DUF1275 domain-containing protein [Ruminococcus sp.]